tara:strand:+ start:1161 stop:1649 length:489 start_codon:yes stop_codon:yes gene_type:complete
MAQNKDNFKQALAFGQDGEREIAKKLITKGFYVLPLYQFQDEISPKIIGNENYISPDLICFKNNNTIFIEVKSKRQWVYWKGQLETGCNYQHYKHYRDIAAKTKIKTYMVFNHVDGDYQGIYYIDVLKNGRYWDGKAKDKVYKAEYFWNKNDLLPFETFLKI